MLRNLRHNSKLAVEIYCTSFLSFVSQNAFSFCSNVERLSLSGDQWVFDRLHVSPIWSVCASNIYFLKSFSYLFLFFVRTQISIVFANNKIGIIRSSSELHRNLAQWWSRLLFYHRSVSWHFTWQDRPRKCQKIGHNFVRKFCGNI